MARSTARKRALNTLYEADEKGQDILSLLAERQAMPGAPTPLPEYAVTITQGIAEHRKHIDHTLNQCAQGWQVSRMAVVDRNILRIAAWEILYNPEVPDKVAIDEALAQAKVLSDDDSVPFIHGVLSALAQYAVMEAQAREAEEHEALSSQAQESKAGEEQAEEERAQEAQAESSAPQPQEAAQPTHSPA